MRRRREKFDVNLKKMNEQMKAYESIKELFAAKKLAKAKSEILKYLKIYPNDLFAIFLYGRIELDNRNMEEAKKAFLKVSNANGKNKYSALSRLGEIALLENNYSLARKYFEEIIKDSPNNEVHTAVMWSKMERRAKNYKTALDILKNYKYTSEDKEKEMAKLNLIMGKELNGENILRSKEQEREKLLELGKIEKLCGSKEKAKEYFNKLKDGEQDEIYADALVQEIQINIKENNYVKAHEQLQKMENVPNKYYEEFILLKGICYQGMQEYELAIKYFLMVVGCKKDHIRKSASYYLGNLMFAREDFIEAEKYFKESLKEYGEYHESSFFKLMAIYIKEERFNEAEIVADKILELFPEKRFDNGYMLSRQMIEKALGRKPSNPVILYTEKQVDNYSEELAIKHIIENHTGYKSDKSTFNDKIDIKELCEYVKKQMTPSSRIHEDVFDVYSIDYPNVGIEKGITRNKIRVITITNTKNIITMYPSEQTFLPRKCDCEKEEKSKTLSRIDKFNKKYNLK